MCTLLYLSVVAARDTKWCLCSVITQQTHQRTNVGPELSEAAKTCSSPIWAVYHLDVLLNPILQTDYTFQSEETTSNRTNPQKETVTTRWCNRASVLELHNAARGNKNLSEMMCTTYQAAYFLLNAVILTKWDACRAASTQYLSFSCDKTPQRRIEEFCYIKKNNRLLLTGNLICCLMQLLLSGNKLFPLVILKTAVISFVFRNH